MKNQIRTSCLTNDSITYDCNASESYLLVATPAAYSRRKMGDLTHLNGGEQSLIQQLPLSTDNSSSIAGMMLLIESSLACPCTPDWAVQVSPAHSRRAALVSPAPLQAGHLWCRMPTAD